MCLPWQCSAGSVKKGPVAVVLHSKGSGERLPSNGSWKLQQGILTWQLHEQCQGKGEHKEKHAHPMSATGF